MKISIPIIIIGALFIESLIIAFLNSYLLLSSSALSIVIICFLLISKNLSEAERGFLIIVIGAIFLSCTLRPLVLIFNPYLYLYPTQGIPQVSEIEVAYYTLAASVFCFLLGLAVALSVRPSKDNYLRVQWQPIRNYLFAYRVQILICGLCMLILKVLLALFLRVGVFGVSFYDKTAAFTARLIPEVVLMCMITCLLLQNWKYLNWIFRGIGISIFVGIIFVSLAIGSKAGAAYVALVLMIVSILRTRKAELSFSLVIVISLLGIFMVFLLFPWAMAVRHELAAGAGFFSSIANGLSNIYNNYYVLDSLNLFTARLVCFDGSIATGIAIPLEISYVYSPSNISKVIVQGLLPGVHLSVMSMGQAVGKFYTGHSMEVEHSGALGFFASMRVIGGPYFCYPLLFVAGVFLGCAYKSSLKLSYRFDLGLVIGTLFAFYSFKMILSGNLDIIAIEIIAAVFQFFVLVVLFKIFSSTLLNKSK